jgi:hypothetical protein
VQQRVPLEQLAARLGLIASLHFLEQLLDFTVLLLQKIESIHFRSSLNAHGVRWLSLARQHASCQTRR